MKKFFKYFFISLGSLIFLMVVAGFIITYFYEDEVKALVIKNLNEKYIATDIRVGNVEFSVFKKFPNASVELQDVLALPSEEYDKSAFPDTGTDTLFALEHIYLQFNIMDIFFNDYTIRSVHAENGTVNILRDKSGAVNYHFWKETGSDDSSNFSVALRYITIRDIYINYIDRKSNFCMNALSQDLTLQGEFYNDEFEFYAAGKLHSDHLVIDETDYLCNRSVELETAIHVNDTEYEIKRSLLYAEGVRMSVRGNISVMEKQDVLNLMITVPETNLPLLAGILPAEFNEGFVNYLHKGTISATMNIKGISSPEQNPEVTAEFTIQQADFKYDDPRIYLSGIHTKGSYTNGKTHNIAGSVLEIEEYELLLGKNKIRGQGKISNFDNPEIQVSAKSDLILHDLRQNLPFFDTLEILEGKALCNLNLTCKPEDIGDIKTADFLNSLVKGSLVFENVNIKMANSDLQVKKFNGSILFSSHDLNMDSLNFVVNNDRFLFTGKAENFFPYMLSDNQKMTIKGGVTAQTLHLDAYLEEKEDSDTPSSGGTYLPCSETMVLNIKTRVKELFYKEFSADDCKGLLYCMHGSIYLKDIMLHSMHGRINSDIALKPSGEEYALNISADFHNIDIKKLFTSFDNFDQDFILDRHLKGALDAELTFISNLNSNFEIIEKSILAETNFIIRNGELIDFEPMEKLSKFIELEELKHITFSTLQNTIIIKNKKVSVPEMKITSSAFDIIVSGSHTFDNHIEYHLQVLLSDVLSRKAKKAKKENEEFGEIIDDGHGRTRIPIKIEGTVDNYKISYDTKTVREIVKENIKEEGKTIKKILHKEFGWFRKDSTLLKMPEKETEEPKIQLEWDDDF